MAFDSKKFLVRTGSAAVFVIVLLGCILWNYYSFSALFFIVSLWGLHEFYKLMETQGIKAQKFAGFSIAALSYAAVFFMLCQNMNLAIDNTRMLVAVFIFIAVLLSFLVSIIELFRNKVNPIQNIAVTISGLFYVVLPFVLLNLIACVPNNDGYLDSPLIYKPTLIISIFLLIWSNDTFAYLVGSFIGKNKMYERISPGKTWEGTIGGAILTVASSFLIYKWFGILELNDWIIISVIVAVFGTLGDLVESMLKRSVGVKDSGSIMPGHGGILDRFDSLIMVAPFVFLYLILK